MVQRIAFSLAGLALAAGLTLAAGELTVRALRPPPRVQVVRPDALGISLRWRGEVPVWQSDAAAPRYNRNCLRDRPDAPRVVAFGDSIFAGVQVEPARVWTRRLEGRIEPTPCVLDLAEPGYGMQNELEVARRELPALAPDVVIWELWHNSSSGYTRVGDTAYRFRDLVVGPDGTPNPLGVPVGAHRWLLPRVRLYELATLALAPVVPALEGRGRQREVLLAAFEEAEALTLAAGARMVVVGCPFLDRPFSEHVSTRRRDWQVDPGAALPSVDRWLRERGHAVVWLDELLAEQGEDHLAVRLDPCCHFNERGQAVIAEVLAPVVAAALGDARAR